MVVSEELKMLKHCLSEVKFIINLGGTASIDICFKYGFDILNIYGSISTAHGYVNPMAATKICSLCLFSYV